MSWRRHCDKGRGVGPILPRKHEGYRTVGGRKGPQMPKLERNYEQDCKRKLQTEDGTAVWMLVLTCTLSERK